MRRIERLSRSQHRRSSTTLRSAVDRSCAASAAPPRSSHGALRGWGTRRRREGRRLPWGQSAGIVKALHVSGTCVAVSAGPLPRRADGPIWQTQTTRCRSRRFGVRSLGLTAAAFRNYGFINIGVRSSRTVASESTWSAMSRRHCDRCVNLTHRFSCEPLRRVRSGDIHLRPKRRGAFRPHGISYVSNTPSATPSEKQRDLAMAHPSACTAR